jgi:hypothetical protein
MLSAIRDRDPGAAATATGGLLQRVSAIVRR